MTSSPTANKKSGMPNFVFNRVININCDALNNAAIVKVTQNNLRNGTVLKYFL